MQRIAKKLRLSIDVWKECAIINCNLEWSNSSSFRVAVFHESLLVANEAVIPTKVKNKLPKQLAYPVGAQEISMDLASVPQVDELELWFLDNRYSKSIVENKRLAIAALYRKDNLGMSASRMADELGLYGPSWSIEVSAVPSSLSSSVSMALHDHGFKRIRDWFTQPRTELWLTKSHSFKLWYSDKTQRLIPSK